MFKIPVRFLKQTFNFHCNVRTFLSKHCPPYVHHQCIPKKKNEVVKITVLGATTRMGQLLSLMLKQCPLVDELRLYSCQEQDCGLALELAQIDTNSKVKGYFGSDLLPNSIEGAQVLVVCSDLPQAPLCEAKYVESFGYQMKTYATFASEINPDAIFCICCPPVNSLVPLVSEEYKRSGVYDHRKIIGMSMVACSRANAVIGGNTNRNPCSIRVPVIGGLCSETTVPVISKTKPKVDVHPNILELMYSKIINSEDQILEEKCKEGTGGCNILYAFAASRFVTSVLKAIRGDNNVYECAYVRQIDEIGEFLPYMSTLVRLSEDGLAGSYMPTINEFECNLLKNARKGLQKSIHLGKRFVTGEYPKQPKRVHVSAICEPPDVDTFVLKATFPEPHPDPCGVIKEAELKDPKMMRKAQQTIKLKFEERLRKSNPKKPGEEMRTMCRKKKS